jgi:hypothetical protein
MYASHPRSREFAAGHLIYYGLLHHPGPDGKTAAELWESQNWAGLNNDENFMMRYRRHSYLTVIEIQKRVSPQAVQAIDLLHPDGAPFLIVDQVLAGSAARFTRYFTWLTHYPHFSRLAGNAFEIPAPLWPVWRALVQAQYSEQRQGRPDLSLKEFLAKNMESCSRLIHQLAEEHRQKVLESLHHQIYGALYRLEAPSQEVEAILRSKPDFAWIDPSAGVHSDSPLASFHWLCQGESAELKKELSPALPRESDEPSVTRIGLLKLYPDRIIVETMGQQKYAFARRMMDKFFGRLVRFEKEEVVDLAEVQAMRHRAEEIVGRASAWLDQQHPLPSGHPSAAPSDRPVTSDLKSASPAEAADSWESRRRHIEETHRKYYQGFLDDPHPELDQSTPTQAAQNPTLRPRLVELLKSHLNLLERRNRSEGLQLDLDWVLDALGMAELK